MRNDSKAPFKVLGIGLNKTGTTSFQKCGQALGFRCKSCDRSLLKEVVLHKDLSRLMNVAGEYDWFEDWPWPLVYREFDRQFPGSKFVLTTRMSPERWITSLKSHSLRTDPFAHCRKLAYGHSYPHGKEELFLDIYRKHNDQARGYFAKRPNDFIELCWENGDGFEKLCAFLGLDVPKEPFPHANKGSEQRPSRYRAFLNQILRHIVR